MRNLLLLLAVACGNDITDLAQSQGDDCATTETLSEGPHDAGGTTELGLGEGQPVSVDQEGAVPEEVPTLCLLVAAEPAEFLLRVRASAKRFRDRLGIPVALCDTGVPILVQEHVWQSPGHGLGGKASYEGPVCRFSECSTRAKIQIAQHETELPDTIDAVIDHEIGHVLSAWGKFSEKTDSAGHLPSGNLMGGNLLPPHQQWTQDDIDLWCSVSPCDL